MYMYVYFLKETQSPIHISCHAIFRTSLIWYLNSAVHGELWIDIKAHTESAIKSKRENESEGERIKTTANIKC
jgi:hypothetical protein